MTSATPLVGSFESGDSVLHRLPPGPKLIALAVFGVAVVTTRSMPMAWLFLTIAMAVAVLGRVRLRTLGRAARGVLMVAVLIAAFQWWLFGRDKAIETVVDLLALALMAVIFTATTSPTLMLDRVTAWVRPLRHVGLDPDKIALSLSLAMQAIPGTIAVARETRDAARARGLDRSARAHVSPFVIRVVARAHDTGDALAARGLGDP